MSLDAGSAVASSSSGAASKRLRIGHQLSARTDGARVAVAQRAEELGFDIVLAAESAELLDGFFKLHR